MKAAGFQGRCAGGRGQNGSARGSIAAAGVAIAALLAMIACGGCIWLAIPSLAYEGYKAEKASQSTQKSHANPQSAPSPSDSDIE